MLAASSTLYVDGSSSSCSDTGSGTQTQPYCTIGAAARSATAGMSVVVNSGTYHEDVSVAHSGVQGAPITLAPAAGASVTITGQSNGFTISGQSWVTISGFNVTGTSSFGIQLSNSAHIIVDGNHVSYSGLPVSGQTAGGIYLNGTTNSLIENNTVDHNTDPGISTHNSSTNDEIRHNVAFNNAEQWQRNAQGIDVESASVTVDYNITHDNEDSGIQFYPGGNKGIAFGNVTYNNGDHGIDNLNVTGGVLTGNTVYHNCTDGINVEGTSGNYTVENNIAVDNAVYPAYNGISCNRRTGNIGIYDSAPATTTLDYNLVYLTTTGDLYVWANTAYSSPAALFAATGQEAHGLQGDPKWLSPTMSNFHLQEGSPAIDSANSAAPSEPIVDIDGNPRVDDPSTPNTGTGPRAYDDRGAYEFQLIDTQPPSVPTGLAASSPNQTQVKLTWSPSTDDVGVAGYTVYRNGAQLTTVTSPGYTDGSVSPSTTYSYTVDAFDFANNHSAQTSPVSVTTPAPDMQPPTVPTGLTVPSVGATLVSLAWNASTDNVGVTGYTIYRNGVAVATPTTTSYTDTGLTPSTTYTYAVDAFDAAGNHSGQSSAVPATTTAKPVAYVQSGTISTGGRVTTSTLKLSKAVSAGDLLTGLFGQWDAAGQVQVSDNLNGPWTRAQGITYATGKGDVALNYLANSRASATGLTITISASASTYLRGTVGEYSGIATSSPLNQVALHSGEGLSVDSGPTASVAAGELVFGAVTGNNNLGTVTGGSSEGLTFTVRSVYRTSADADILTGSAGTQDSRFTISNLVTWYAVAAVFKPSGAVSDTTPPSTPGALTATNGTGSVTLNWNASTDNVGVTGYTVYRNGSTFATVGGSVLSYKDSSVASATTYSYSVDAFDAAGNHSAPSAVVSDTTLDWIAPTVPASLTATAPGPTQVNLAWNASTDNVGVTGYTVYRNGTTLATVSGSTLTYSDLTVAANTSYSYTVDAIDAAGNHSAQSAPVSVHVPGQPKFVQGKAFSTGSRVTSITVTLGPVSNGDLLVGWFGQYDSSGQVGVSDNVNGAWTRSASTTWSGSSGDIALYYFANSAAAAAGLTITITATNATYLQGAPAEYSGVATVNPLDQVVIAKGSGTSADSGLTTATGSGELVYGGMTTTNAPGTLTPGSSQGVGFVKRAQNTSGSQSEEDIVTSAPGQQHAGFTFLNSVPWFMVCAVFKPA